MRRVMRVPVPPLWGAVPGLQYGDRDRGETSPVSRTYLNHSSELCQSPRMGQRKTKAPLALARGAVMSWSLPCDLRNSSNSDALLLLACNASIDVGLDDRRERRPGAIQSGLHRPEITRCDLRDLFV